MMSSSVPAPSPLRGSPTATATAGGEGDPAADMKKKLAVMKIRQAST